MDYYEGRLGNIVMYRWIEDHAIGFWFATQLWHIVISLFEGGKTMSGRSNAASIRTRRTEWAINDRMPHADEPLFSSNRHCNMKHRQLPDKIIIRLITCQLQTLVVCLLIYSPPRRLQFQRCCKCVPSHSAETGSRGRQK